MKSISLTAVCAVILASQCLLFPGLGNAADGSGGSSDKTTADKAAIDATSQQNATADAASVDAATLPDIVIYGDRELMESDISADDVYYDDESSTYKSKDDLDRFVGESPSDIFKGMVGVESGDARNSGAIDPNVRGIQGQGRVPVTIDGTEQAITANRGYQGASNRNYIDPLLISDVKVSKGVSMQRGVQSSVGGAVTINTLNVSDVLAEGQNIGADFTATVGNNTTRARAINPYDYVGDNASNYPEELYPVHPAIGNNPDRRKAFLQGLGKLPRRWNTYTSPGIIGKKPKANPSLGSVADSAWRLAIAGRNDRFEALAAYAYRDRGNYFAGKRGSKRYRSDTPSEKRDQSQFASVMADVYRPKHEVPNSSIETESYLLKATWKPSTRQALQFGYRHTDSITGDIMPARVADDRDTSMFARTGLLPQWPLSKIKLDAYNLRYKWQPDNRWLNIDANLWHTDSNTQTHNSGGDPIRLLGPFRSNTGTQQDFADYRQGFVSQFQSRFPGVVNCPDRTLLNPDYSRNPEDKCVQAAMLYRSTFTSNSATSIDNQRTGVSFSNLFKLTDKFNVTLAANYQQEKLKTENAADINSPFFTVAPGEGRRRAGDVSVNARYRPLPWLVIGAGVRYDKYWAMDDYVKDTQIKPTSHTQLGHHLTAFHKKPPELPVFPSNQPLQAVFPLFFTPLPVLQTHQALGAWLTL